MVLEKTLERTTRRSNQFILKEINPGCSLEGLMLKLKTPVLWLPDAKSWLIGKDPDAGKYWGWEEKGKTEDEMVGWHQRLNRHGFGWTPGVGDGQGGLVCCGSWGCKESDTTEQLKWTELKDSPVCQSCPYSKWHWTWSVHSYVYCILRASEFETLRLPSLSMSALTTYLSWYHVFILANIKCLPPVKLKSTSIKKITPIWMNTPPPNFQFFKSLIPFSHSLTLTMFIISLFQKSIGSQPWQRMWINFLKLRPRPPLVKCTRRSGGGAQAFLFFPGSCKWFCSCWALLT